MSKNQIPTEHTVAVTFSCAKLSFLKGLKMKNILILKTPSTLVIRCLITPYRPCTGLHREKTGKPGSQNSDTHQGQNSRGMACISQHA